MPRVLPPVLWLLVLCSMWLLHAVFPALWWVPERYRALGCVPLVAGVGIAVVARLQFARARTQVNTFAQPQHLVTSGLFRWTRNPMYLGMALAAAGAALWCGAMTSWLPVLAFIAVTDRFYIAFEEQRLLDVFGSRYAAYREATRRWL
jgi:protein-S-isoprenylcysteine O-methyltransferase Ste14